MDSRGNIEIFVVKIKRGRISILDSASFDILIGDNPAMCLSKLI